MPTETPSPGSSAPPAAAPVASPVTTPRPAAPLVARVRAGRAGLRRALHDLEDAIATPVQHVDAWREQVRERVVGMQQAWSHHIEVTESADGLHPTLVADAARLVHGVATLRREHASIAAALARLCDATRPTPTPGGSTGGEVAALRAGATDVITAVMRHRQRGADLVWEAYAVDLGGSD